MPAISASSDNRVSAGGPRCVRDLHLARPAPVSELDGAARAGIA